MSRVNITMPEDVRRAARDARLNISDLAHRAVVAELERRAKLADLYALVDELNAEFGPPTEAELNEAEAWVESLRAEPRPRRSSGRRSA